MVQVQYVDNVTQWAGNYVATTNYVYQQESTQDVGVLNDVGIEITVLDASTGAYTVTFTLPFPLSTVVTTVAQAFIAPSPCKCKRSRILIIKSQNAELTLTATCLKQGSVAHASAQGTGGYPDQNLAGIVYGNVQRVLM